MVELVSLHATAGDKPRVFLEDDSDPLARDQMAQGVQALLNSGTALFLVVNPEQSFLIKGYDPENHEWILSSRTEKPNTPETSEEEPVEEPKRRGRPRVSAKDTSVEAVPARSGG